MTPLVRIHDLCLHLNGRAILHHVDLELPRHGISVLLGRSGSGKTSFLRCLNRLHDCTKDSRMQGQVELLLDGEMRDISRLRGEEALSRLRRQVGMVFQPQCAAGQYRTKPAAAPAAGCRAGYGRGPLTGPAPSGRRGPVAGSP